MKRGTLKERIARRELRRATERAERAVVQLERPLAIRPTAAELAEAEGDRSWAEGLGSCISRGQSIVNAREAAASAALEAVELARAKLDAILARRPTPRPTPTLVALPTEPVLSGAARPTRAGRIAERNAEGCRTRAELGRARTAKRAEAAGLTGPVSIRDVRRAENELREARAKRRAAETGTSRLALAAWVEESRLESAEGPLVAARAAVAATKREAFAAITAVAEAEGRAEEGLASVVAAIMRRPEAVIPLGGFLVIDESTRKLRAAARLAFTRYEAAVEALRRIERETEQARERAAGFARAMRSRHAACALYAASCRAEVSRCESTLGHLEARYDRAALRRPSLAERSAWIRREAVRIKEWPPSAVEAAKWLGVSA